MARLTPAVLRSLDILELFLERHEGMTKAEIVAVTGIPRSSVHELLATLVDRDYLRLDPATGRYRLGVKVFRLGNSFGDQLDLRVIADRAARTLSSEIDETVNVGVLDGLQVIYLSKVDSDRAVRLVSRMGGTLPASCTAVGKALLAYASPSTIAALRSGPLARLTDRSITDQTLLDEDLARTRDRGTSYESGESTPDVTCVGAPVRDHTGAVVASMSISVPDLRWPHRSEGDWRRLIKDAAEAMSAELGRS
ncbi:IclR family transcriptional regulator [Microlunatus soli]|uniref:Glycerol operon regulatory protein n=1 Tax=Microlunatus soli TaxID=630515 RepID=A0A1H2ANS9_9ACTN|nr:IclR family transcriptional regulator [Microlunatus soli]SDT47600.1 DNA-binding transcriptional regulator, IclR family [Microlunatus soli]